MLKQMTVPLIQCHTAYHSAQTSIDRRDDPLDRAHAVSDMQQQPWSFLCGSSLM